MEASSVSVLAAEQAALRRVATLVAQGVPPEELFAAAIAEVGQLLGTDLAGMIRYEEDGTVLPVAAWAAVGEHPPLPGRWQTEPGDPAMMVAQTLAPARVEDWSAVPGPIAAFIRDVGVSSSVGCPILVSGRLWGALAVHTMQAEPLPADTESRLASFTELIATAIANAQARSEMSRLAAEQAALRRVATLVASEPAAELVFATVTEEVGRLLAVENSALARYEEDDTVTVVATWGKRHEGLPVGTRAPVGGNNVTSLVKRTGRPARIDDYRTTSGEIGDRLRKLGTGSAVGCPVTVDGRLWGIVVATQGEAGALPADSESRIALFTELVAMAISNVQARADLAASRTRIVAAADDERRRVVRDLHDGAQQRLVHMELVLKQALDAEPGTDRELVAEALAQAEQATTELRELAHGILPSVLTHGGLEAGVQALTSRVPVPVENDVSVERMAVAVEATAYLVVSEALTNVAKHSQASRASVFARVDDGMLLVQVRDDGVGGARRDGQGLVGLADRLAALDGRFEIDSPAGGGTLVAAEIPL